MKIRFKLIAIVISVLMAIYAIPLGAYAELFETTETDAEEKDILITEESIAEETYIFEDASLRDENVKHFRLDDGSYIAAQYPYAVHVKDENGIWQDIDNTLADKSSDYSTSNARVKFAKKTTGNETLFTLHDGNYKITMSLDGANKKVEGQVTNNMDAESETDLQKMLHLEKLSSSIVYPDILDGVDLEYVVDSLNIKENIIVKGKNDRYTYAFTLKLNNLSAVRNDDGSVSVFDPKTNENVYVIPSPVVYDAAGVYAETNKASYALSDCGNGKYTFTVTADSEWMNADERTWPITIDPAIYVNLYDDMSDTFISSSSTSSSFGGYTYMDSGHGSSGQEYITYWMPDILPTIPENAYIVSADLALHLRSYITSANVSELLLGVYPVTSSWTSSHTWTKYTAGTNGTMGALYECVRIIPEDATQYISFNITDIARQWIDGTLTNYGVAIRQVGTDYAYARFDATNKQSNMPRLTVKYHNPKGLESYWSYSTHNLPVGTGHVNLASGALTLVIPTLSTTEAIFGFTPSLVYNSGIYNEYNINENNDNVPHIVTSAGYGWQLNVNESVLKKTYINADGESETYYILTDSDGTEHAFYLDKSTNTYKDEDGLLLTLTEEGKYYHIEDSSHTIKSYRKITNNTSSNEGSVLNIITDKFGNKLKVYNYTNGRCNGIAFCPANGSDVSHMTLSYNAGGCISAITNSTTGHKVTFEYSTSTSGSSSASAGGYLKKMIFSKTSGSTTTNYSIIEFSYRSSGELYIIKDTVTGKSIYYQYSSGKTTIVREKGGSTWGKTIGITYGDGTTTIRSSGEDDKYSNADDIMTHYSFDNKGRAISTYSSNVDGNIIFGASSGQYSDVAENKLNAQITSGQTGVNYLLNGSFNFGGSTLTNIDDWYKSSSRVSRISYYNDYALRILPQANSADYVNQFTQLAVGDYTLSLDCETTKCENVSVKMKVISMSTSGESYVKDIPINQNTTNGKISPYLTFNIPSGGAYEIKLEVTGGSSVDANASVIIDNVMLERNIGSTGSNLITFGDFDNNALTAEGNSSFTNFSDYWSFSTNNTSIIALNSNDVIRGTSLRINGSVGNSYCAYQTIPFPYENVIYDFIPARFFEVSGFGQGSHQTSSGYFGLAVTITYFDNTTSIDYIPFNNEVTDLQYASGIIVVPQYSIIKSIQVACIYENNPGTAYFDDISIIQVGNSNAAAYEYYEDTQLLKIKETPENTTFYEYDSSGNLIRQADFDLNYSSYSYTNNALTSEESGTFHSIGEGLLLIEAIEQGAYQTSPIIKTDYTYNTYGLVTRTDTYSPSATTKLIRTTAYYDTAADSKTFGVLLSSTDQNGDTVQYGYDSSTGQLQYQVNADGSSGLYYTYDSIGRLVNVVPLVYYPSVNSYFGEYGLEYVDYYYNSLQQLSGISTDTTDYTFTYDEFGNTASISAGNYTLATYTYNTYNGKLASMTYGNGTTVSYTYDALDRIEKISYNGTVRYEYQYTAEGQLHSVSDLVNGIGYLYEYDGEDRIVGYVQYSLNNKTNTLGILYTYDEKSRLFEATTTIDYSIGADTTTQSLLEQYLYNDETNTLSYYMVLFGYYTGNRIEAEFTYDDVQRIDTKKYTLTTSSALTNTIELTYADRSSGRLLSSFVNTYSTQMGTSTATTYTYTYDDNGNITKIVDNAGKTTKYTYDDLGQLVREDNPYKNASYTYTYDNNGNRTSKKTYAYTTGTLGTATSTQTYTYDDATWGDKLTAFNGTAITYDPIGNPLSYNNGTAYTFTWSDGRRLATATKGGVSYSFTYNDEGIRTSKTVGGVKHNYTLEGTRIVSEQWSNKLIIYLYDEVGAPMGMLYRANSYAADTYDIFYFEKNLQGDIIAIYNASGTKLVSYTYDAWGNCTTTYYNGGSSTAAQYNPFRYRGYYFDSELNFYYLNSRYYDPYTGRFINADDSLYQHILGYNMYAYCVNSPVAYIDPTGQLFIIDDLVTGPIDEIIVVVGIIVVAVIVGVAGTSNDTLANEIINSTSDIFVGIEQQASIIWNVLFDESQDNPLPEEQDIKVDIDHIMDRHHPSSGKSPKKDKFPKWMTPIVIEKIVREAYENARTNYPDSVLKVQEGIRYYIEGFSSNNRIRIWVDTVKKTITTAFPK